MKIGHRPRDRLIVRSGMRKDNVYEQSTHFALMLRNPDDHQASNDFPRHLLLTTSMHLYGPADNLPSCRCEFASSLCMRRQVGLWPAHINTAYKYGMCRHILQGTTSSYR